MWPPLTSSSRQLTKSLDQTLVLLSFLRPKLLLPENGLQAVLEKVPVVEAFPGSKQALRRRRKCPFSATPQRAAGA